MDSQGGVPLINNSNTTAIVYDRTDSNHELRSSSIAVGGEQAQLINKSEFQSPRSALEHKQLMRKDEVFGDSKTGTFLGSRI